MTYLDDHAGEHAEWKAFIDALPKPPAPPCPDWCPGGHGIHPLNVDHVDGVASGAGVQHSIDLGHVEVSQYEYVNADGTVTDRETPHVGLYVDHIGESLTAAQARTIAAELARAADILDSIQASTSD